MRDTAHPGCRQKSAKVLGYSPSEHRVQNAGVLVQCDESNKWRLIFSKRKLSAKKREQLQDVIQDVSYSCGASIDDLILPESLASIGIKKHSCSDHVEKLYYTFYGSDDPICIHCGSSTELTLPKSSELFYPYCRDSASFVRINNRLLKH